MGKEFSSGVFAQTKLVAESDVVAERRVLHLFRLLDLDRIIPAQARPSAIWEQFYLFYFVQNKHETFPIQYYMYIELQKKSGRIAREESVVEKQTDWLCSIRLSSPIVNLHNRLPTADTRL